MFQFRMVAQNQRHFAGQVPFADVGQQVVQAVGGFGHQDRHAAAVITEMQRIFQIHPCSDFRKGFRQGPTGHAVFFHIDHHTHVVAVFPHITVLLTLHHVECMTCKKGGDFRQNTFAVFGLDQKTSLFCHNGIFLEYTVTYYRSASSQIA